MGVGGRAGAFLAGRGSLVKRDGDGDLWVLTEASPSPLTLGEDMMVELCEWVVASSAVRGRGTSAAVRDGGASFSGLK